MSEKELSSMTKKSPINEASLAKGEFHPSASGAMDWLKLTIMDNPKRYMTVREAIASVALSGNRLAQLCNSTLQRLEDNEPVSDRYLLGLCWFLRDMIDQDAKKK